MSEQLVNYNITDAAIGEMREQFLKLRIVDLADTAGAKAVSSARRSVKAKRCEVEKLRKDLKASALDWGRRVDSEARRITELLLPIEQHLEAEEARIEEEKARVRAEEEARQEAARRVEHERIMARVQELQKYGGAHASITVFDIGALSDMDYDDLLEDTRAAWVRKEEERKAEEERVNAVRLEQAAERERIAEERRILDEEKRAMKERLAAIPPAELPSVIEMINEYRDHTPEFLAEVEDPPDGPALKWQAKITTGTEDILFDTSRRLLDAIGQWVDEAPLHGDTITIKISMVEQ